MDAEKHIKGLSERLKSLERSAESAAKVWNEEKDPSAYEVLRDATKHMLDTEEEIELYKELEGLRKDKSKKPKSLSMDDIDKLIPKRKNREDVLNQAEDYLIRNLTAIHDMRNGMSEEEAVKKNGLKLSKLRMLMFRHAAKDEMPGNILSGKLYPLFTGYERLYAIIMSERFGKKYKQDWEIVDIDNGLQAVRIPHNHFMPVGLKKSFRYVLKTLTPREQRIVVDIGIRALTFEQCAKEHDVTRERIRQIYAKALRKLSHPSRLTILTYGLDMVDRQKKAKEKAKVDVDYLIATEYKKEYKDYLNKQMKQMITGESEEVSKTKDIPIEDMDLSVRAYNCLYRAHIVTVSQLSEMTVERLMKVRNLGRKSMNEVILRLKDYGIEIKYEDGSTYIPL